MCFYIQLALRFYDSIPTKRLPAKFILSAHLRLYYLRVIAVCVRDILNMVKNEAHIIIYENGILPIQNP